MKAAGFVCTLQPCRLCNRREVYVSRNPATQAWSIKAAGFRWHLAIMSLLLECWPCCRRVVYVSCNPATQARDLGLLCGQVMAAAAGGAAATEEDAAWPQGTGPRFRLASVTPCDIFPHTDHIETVAVLERIW